jgi:hypothetical protein
LEPWGKGFVDFATLKGFATHVAHTGNKPFQGYITIHYLFPGLPKLNPGLKFANTFGVID